MHRLFFSFFFFLTFNVCQVLGCYTSSSWKHCDRSPFPPSYSPASPLLPPPRFFLNFFYHFFFAHTNCSIYSGTIAQVFIYVYILHLFFLMCSLKKNFRPHQLPVYIHI